MSTKKSYEVTPLNLPVYHTIGHLPARRLLAFFLFINILLLPALLVYVPWQQNVSGTGRVSALNPLERVRTIPAPVSGRLIELNVQEGSFVKKGDLLAKMEDLDKDYVVRLANQLGFVRKELEAAHSTLEFLDNQLIQLHEERQYAVKSASSKHQIAIEKVRTEQAVLIGLKAALVQKEQDFKRKERLLNGGAISELDFQKAEGAYKLAKSKFRAGEAKVDQARNEELVKASDIQKVSAEKMAKIDKLQAERKKYEQKIQQTRKRVTVAETDLQRQSSQEILAPRDGTVLRVHGATSNLISRGQSLIEMMPETEHFALEFWVRGIDAPLVTPGRQAQIQFEGWPAIQVGGWPSVAMGTFRGIVYRCDAQARQDGKVRVLIIPDPESNPWPEQPILRQGARVSGQIQLDTVSIGYEIWRQLNAFPLSMNHQSEMKSDSPKKSSYQKEDKPKKSESKK